MEGLGIALSEQDSHKEQSNEKRVPIDLVYRTPLHRANLAATRTPGIRRFRDYLKARRAERAQQRVLKPEEVRRSPSTRAQRAKEKRELRHQIRARERVRITRQEFVRERAGRRVALNNVMKLFLVRAFARWTGIVLGFLVVVHLMGDSVTLIGRLNRRETNLLHLPELLWWKLPLAIENVLPFAIVAGITLACSEMQNQRAVVVLRATGISIRQLATVAGAFAFCVGLLATLVLSPWHAAATQQDKFLSRNLSRLDALPPIDFDNLWIRTVGSDAYAVVRVGSWSPSTTTITDITTFTYFSQDQEGSDATGGTINVQHRPSRTLEGESGRQVAQALASSAARPENVGFWQLPQVVVNRSDLGLDTNEYRLKWQQLLSLPLLFAALGLLGAGLVLRLGSRITSRRPIVLAIILGLVVLFVRKYFALQASLHQLPHEIAVFFPIVLCFLLASFMLLGRDRA